MEIVWKVEDRIIDGVGLLKRNEKKNVPDDLGKQLIQQGLADKPGKKTSKGGK